MVPEDTVDDRSPPMTLPRGVAEILREHVTLEMEGIDRMSLNEVVPILQGERGLPGSFASGGGMRSPRRR
jgi:hypothetical protein